MLSYPIALDHLLAQSNSPSDHNIGQGAQHKSVFPHDVWTSCCILLGGQNQTPCPVLPYDLPKPVFTWTTVITHGLPTKGSAPRWIPNGMAFWRQLKHNKRGLGKK